MWAAPPNAAPSAALGLAETDKFCCSASWCGFSARARDQLEKNPVSGLQIVDCDKDKEHFACAGVQGFPTYKHCTKDQPAVCSSMSGHVSPEKVYEFFSQDPSQTS
jgi:hypothetical protein